MLPTEVHVLRKVFAFYKLAVVVFYVFFNADAFVIFPTFPFEWILT
jgi:hypothetical protein